MRLIDGDELRDIYSSVPNGVYTTGHIITAIDECKTIDAAPVKHGRWELVDEAEPRRYGCSECSCLSWYGTYKYCPNCGAKMDGGEENG